MCPNRPIGISVTEFDYENEYQFDTRMAHVDACSRFPNILINDDSFLL